MATGDVPTYADKHIVAVEADIDRMRMVEQDTADALNTIRSDIAQARRLLSFLKQGIKNGAPEATRPTPVAAEPQQDTMREFGKRLRSKSIPIQEYKDAIELVIQENGSGEFTTKQVAELMDVAYATTGRKMRDLVRAGYLYSRNPPQKGQPYRPATMYRKRHR